jgi:hypothetical protein
MTAAYAGASPKRPVSGARVFGTMGSPGGAESWPVIATPSLSISRGRRVTGLLRLMQDCVALQPTRRSGNPQDLPARACPNCAHPLPVDIDDRRIVTIAVLGTSSAGKTHYLASAMYQACRMQGLDPVGCDQFEADDLTAKRYHEEYFEPLFVQKRTLASTNLDAGVQFRPLVYRVRFRNSLPCSILFHDVSGEMLYDPEMRARYAQFIYRADGAIFLIDPDQLAIPRGHTSRHGPASSATYNQADMLISWLSNISQTIPVAVTLSKSDLVTAAFPGSFKWFSQPSPSSSADWSREMGEISREVLELFRRLDAHDLVAASRRRGNSTTFHAVTALGGNPDEMSIEHIQPRRCLDPLVTLLTRIPDIIGPPAA